MHDAFGRTPIRSKASTLAYYQALYQGYGKYYLIERVYSTSACDAFPIAPAHNHSNFNGVRMGFDPYNYTSGHWLRDDKEERASRYIKFDFDALCRKILDLSPKASSIIDCQKIEGGFNRVFVFGLDNDTRLVAKLPFALAGPSRLTTSSEIATTKYLQANTTVPIPRILDWSDDATSINNPIGSEYIIMEHANGVQLHKKWHEMSDKQRRCPYALPPPPELADHEKKYRLFEAAHNLRCDLAGLLNTATDGWVPTSDWEAAQTAHHEMFEGMLQAVLTNPDIDDPDEPVKDEETLRSIWPFDI
ncbi:hypothetical protein CBS147323_7335 [Aspergillus niger]|nr:hypothetical protein CBS147323_7335 [Aspergillus niger]KAI3022735.1 hypothetical protein CBS147347_7263 [Aspergillus niger]KAI3069384.1 hypothetical protein CBS147353_7157 [Aspergillus niger]